LKKALASGVKDVLLKKKLVSYNQQREFLIQKQAQNQKKLISMNLPQGFKILLYGSEVIPVLPAKAGIQRFCSCFNKVLDRRLRRSDKIFFQSGRLILIRKK